MMNRNRRTAAALIALLVLLMLSSGAVAQVQLGDTDYANLDNWLCYTQDGGKPVDIFAVYPTVSFSPDEADIPFLRLDSLLMRTAAEGWLAENIGLLDAGNVYAPLYQQLNGVMLGDLDPEGFESYTIALPRDDVFAAFDYFLKNINKGERPFLLFGHSQGACLVGEIATVMLGDEAYAAYNDGHIATYAIGYSVESKDIAKNPNLAFAAGPTDTGVILSWNTTAPSEIGTGAYKGFGTWKDGALTINPISWTTEEVLAHAADNPTARVQDADGNPAAANALVDREHSVLVVTSLDEADFQTLTPTVSKDHRYDVMFFYDAIRQNIMDRAEAFLQGR